MEQPVHDGRLDHRANAGPAGYSRRLVVLRALKTNKLLEEALTQLDAARGKETASIQVF